jgi:hypothetical protein
MKNRLLLCSAAIALALLFAAAPVGAKVAGLAGKWSGYWIPNDGSRQPAEIEFSDNTGGKGRFTAPGVMEFTMSTVDLDSGRVLLEATDAKSGKTYRLEGTIENTELNAVMTVGDNSGEFWVSNSFLKRLDHGELSTFLRESEYGFVFFLTIHILGMSCLVGANSIVSMRLLGVASVIPLKPLRRLFPVMWTGFFMADVSGIAIGLAHASTRLWNPILAVKLVIIASAAPLMRIMQKRVFDDPKISEAALPASAKRIAAAQLILWLLVLVAGRLVAYSFTILGEGY